MDRENIYSISIEDVQLFAVEKVGRRLTDDELKSVGKGLRQGMNIGLDTILDTAIEEAVLYSSFKI